MPIVLELEKDRYGDPQLIVEVDCDGEVIEAQTYSELFNCYLFCTYWIQSSTLFKAKIAEAFAEYREAQKVKNWNRDEDLETA